MKNKPLEKYNPRHVGIRLYRGEGKVCKALVRPGDRVVRGQVIGLPVDEKDPPVYASITGTVTDVLTEKISYGLTGEIIIITWEDRDGMMAMETGKKREERSVRTILINGMEKEQCFSSDYRLMMEQSAKVALGAMKKAIAAGAKSVIFCVRESESEAGYCLMKSAEKFAVERPDIVFSERSIRDDFLCSHPKVLVQKVLHKEIPNEGIPENIGVSVVGVEEAVGIYNLEYDGIGKIQRFITVGGNVDAVNNFTVPMGTPFRELLEVCGGVDLKSSIVLEGGPMTGHAVDVDRAYVSEGTDGIYVVKKEETEEKNCIRCGACVEVCPARIFPFKIEKAFSNQKFLYDALDPQACIECGRCSYVCPSQIRLKEKVVLAKKEKGGYIHWREPQKHKKGHYVFLYNGEDLPPCIPQYHMSPYIHSGAAKEQGMLRWFIGLLPILLIMSAAWGTRGIFNMLTAVLTCVVSDGIYRFIIHGEKKPDLWEAINMGLLLAFVFPAEVPPLELIIAGAFGTIAVKALFGGYGSQIFQPVLMARILFDHGPGMIATPFSWIMIGTGFIYLAYTGAASLWPSVWYLFTVWVVGLMSGEIFLLSGPLLLTAFFLIQDPVTSPCFKQGKVIFAVIGGLLAGGMWNLGFGEWAWYLSVLMVNPLAEAIERFAGPVPYGKMPFRERKKRKTVQIMFSIWIAAGFLALLRLAVAHAFTGIFLFEFVQYIWFGLAVWSIYKRISYMYSGRGFLKYARFAAALMFLAIILEKMRI